MFVLVTRKKVECEKKLSKICGMQMNDILSKDMVWSLLNFNGSYMFVCKGDYNRQNYVTFFFLLEIIIQ